MSVIKCKICGGDIELNSDKTFGTCENCGSSMTFPKISDEQRLSMFNRGNAFRRAGEFDKALALYENIVREDDTDAEAHWCCALCRFGIEYVEDPATFEFVPTCHRASFDNFLDDIDYKSALENADGITRRQYQKDAMKIADVQRGILATSRNEEPFDIFICYKETDDNTGSRTRDSIDAQEIYYQLTNEGYRVFFSRITLEDKAGTEYEPYIFAALNSAKVMVVIGSRPEYFNAVWVKNEWSRFLAIMRKDRHKLLLPCYKNMDPYDLPEQLSVLQSYDMTKIGFIQDLIRGIKKITATDEPKAVVKETVVVNNANSNANVVALKKRGFMALEDGEWQKADDFFEEALNQDAEDAECYLGKLMAELKVKTKDNLKDCAQPFDDKNNCVKASRFSSEIADKLKTDNESIRERNEEARKLNTYNRAMIMMRNAKTDTQYRDAASNFALIPGYNDADEQRKLCLEKAEIERKDALYYKAVSNMKGQFTEAKLNDAIKTFYMIPDWKDSESKIEECRNKIEEHRIAEENAKKAAENDAIYNSANIKMDFNDIRSYNEAIKLFESIIDWKDSRTKIDECNRKIEEIRIAKAELKRKAEEARIASEKAKAKTKKILSIAIPAACVIIAFIIVLNSFIIPHYKTNNLIEKYGISEESASEIVKAKEGETITFGSYEQDNDATNGKEEIEWIVLEKQDGKMLVISKYALDCLQYNEEYIDVTWETCTLRTWLNGTFHKAAFSSEEQKMIQSTKVTADANPSYFTDSGSDTTDKVFLLSITEAEKYFSSDDDMICKPTNYAVSNGASVYESTGGCWWWLRSPGYDSDYAAYVRGSGGVYNRGYYVDSDNGCVRPAMWIEI